MNYIRLFALLSLLFSLSALAGERKVVRLSKPVQQTPTHETFGQPLDETLEHGTLSELLDDADASLNQPAAVTTRVTEVCQKKGCFLIAQAGDRLVRVSFKDYGFFVPTDISGKEVTLAGVLQRVEVSPEQARHFTSDLGEGATASDPGWQYEFVASTVRVPRPGG